MVIFSYRVLMPRHGYACISTARPAARRLGRYDRNGRLHYLLHTQPLTVTQQHEPPGLLRPFPFQGTGVGHPRRLPLPASWSRNYAARQPRPHLQVEPTRVAEVELNIATDPAGRPRHPARHIRTRAELQPEHVLLWATAHVPDLESAEARLAASSGSLPHGPEPLD